jgi:hypothetical protein
VKTRLEIDEEMSRRVETLRETEEDTNSPRWMEQKMDEEITS